MQWSDTMRQQNGREGYKGTQRITGLLSTSSDAQRRGKEGKNSKCEDFRTQSCRQGMTHPA